MTELHETSKQPGASDRPRSSGPLRFDAILEHVDKLSIEDQDALKDVIKRRRAELRREAIAENVRKSREEFAAGLVNHGTVDELMEEFGR